MLIQIRRDGLFNQDKQILARTEMSQRHVIRDVKSQLLFGFEPYQSCPSSEAEVWIRTEELTKQTSKDFDLRVNVKYSNPRNAKDYTAFKAI